MKYTDDEISKRLGYDLLDHDFKSEMLQSFHDTLDSRVALAVADKLSDEQLEKFVSLNESGDDDEEAMQWLREEIPGLDGIVDEEADKLIEEIESGVNSMLED